MIVIALLGILAALVVPRFSNASDTARISAVQKQLQQLRAQISYYETVESSYPASLATGSGWDSLIDGRYLVTRPRNALRQDRSDIATGTTLTPGADIPGGAAWYWDTTLNRLYAADADGTLLDF